MRPLSNPRRLALVLATAAVALAIPVTSAAAASPVNSITTVLDFSSPTAFPSTPPYFGTWSGTFTTNVPSDSGDVTAQGVLPAQPPNNGQFETTRTLTTDAGNQTIGTITLRCAELVQGFPSTSASGVCGVLHAGGIYAGLKGAGKLTGVADYNALTLTDTIAF